MQNLEQFIVSPGTGQVLFVDANGNVTKGSLGALWETMSSDEGIVNFCGANGGIAQWYADINKLYTVCPDVRVGIGNSEPAYKLHTQGTSFSSTVLVGNPEASSGSIINGFGLSSINDLLKLGHKIGANPEVVKFLVDNTGNIESFNTGAGTAFSIHNGTGNAIVVYANNGNKIMQLEDNGILSTREVKVNTNTWPDYVFEENYKVLSLGETEDYINKNGRLPGIPSATRIINEGINIGEMQVLQMEKMEEIYLHLIDLDKRVQSLEEENEALKKENADLKNK